MARFFVHSGFFSSPLASLGLLQISAPDGPVGSRSLSWTYLSGWFCRIILLILAWTTLILLRRNLVWAGQADPDAAERRTDRAEPEHQRQHAGKTGQHPKEEQREHSVPTGGADRHV